MKLTTKGRYAVTAMLDLALHYEQGAVTLADIAQRQGISLSYLEQLFARLRRHGLVDSIRGPGGGYNLAKDPNERYESTHELAREVGLVSAEDVGSRTKGRRWAAAAILLAVLAVVVGLNVMGLRDRLSGLASLNICFQLTVLLHPYLPDRLALDPDSLTATQSGHTPQQDNRFVHRYSFPIKK